MVNEIGYLIKVNKDGSKALERPVFQNCLIGSSDDCNLKIVPANVHVPMPYCRIKFTNNEMCIFSLAYLNTVYVNGKQVPVYNDGQALKDKDKIVINDNHLFEWKTTADQPPDEASMNDSSPMETDTEIGHGDSLFCFLYNAWKNKPEKIERTVLKVEMKLGDTKELLKAFCSKFGEVRRIISLDISGKKFAFINFKKSTALAKALKSPINDKILYKLNIDSWKALSSNELIEELKSSMNTRKVVYDMFCDAKNSLELSKLIVDDITKLCKKACVRITSQPVVPFIILLLSKLEENTDDHPISSFGPADKIREGNFPIPLSLPIPPLQFKPSAPMGKQPIIITTKVTKVPNAERELFVPLGFDLFDGEPLPYVDDLEYTESDDDKYKAFVEMTNLLEKMSRLNEPWATYALNAIGMLPDNEDYENIQANEVMPTPTKKRKLSRPSSSSSKTSQSSGVSDELADKLGMISFVSFEESNVTQISNDKLHVDVLIICESIQLCRELSGTFGIINIDEIVVDFRNRKDESKKFTFRSFGIKRDLREWWCKKIAERKHKIFRMLQTRYSEYLATGWNNIAITCCPNVTSNTVANFYAYLGTPDQVRSLNMDLYTCAVRYDPENLFLSGVEGLTTIIDHALGKRVSIPMRLRFWKKYYNMNVSAICIIPFFVLRSLSEESIQKHTREIHFKPEPLLFKVE